MLENTLSNLIPPWSSELEINVYQKTRVSKNIQDSLFSNTKEDETPPFTFFTNLFGTAYSMDNELKGTVTNLECI